MQKTDLKSDRDKQVQVRLPASLHKQLKLALIQDDSSLADFFNEAAEAYLKKTKKYRKTVDNFPILWYDRYRRLGEVSEWFKELVLKTSDSARNQGFESLPLRQLGLRKYSSGEEAPLLRE